jgi:hypothetical protein
MVNVPTARLTSSIRRDHTRTSYGDRELRGDQFVAAIHRSRPELAHQFKQADDETDSRPSKLRSSGRVAGLHLVEGGSHHPRRPRRLTRHRRTTYGRVPERRNRPDKRTLVAIGQRPLWRGHFKQLGDRFGS